MKNNEELIPLNAFPDKYNGGMTLRDYFAGQILAGLIASPNRIAGKIDNEIGKTCYGVADMVLKERLK